MEKKNHFYFLVKSQDSFQYLDRCIDSILFQTISDFTIIFIDDCSHYSFSQKQHISSRLRGHIVLFNNEQKFFARNTYEAIHEYTDKSGIIINIRVGDWLLRNDVLEIINEKYKNDNCEYTCDNFLFYLIQANDQQNLRKQIFSPGHLTTWNSDLFKQIPKEYFLRPNGEWVHSHEDLATFFPLIDLAPTKCGVINETIYSYNIEQKKMSVEINLAEALFDEVCIRKKKKLKI